MSLREGIAWLFGSDGEAIEALRDRARVEIEAERMAFETMVSRATAAGTKIDADVVAAARRALDTAVDLAGSATSADTLESLVDQAQAAARQGAYLCPEAEIALEGEESVATLEEWGVPGAVIGRFRSNLLPRLANAEPAIARGALRAILEEYDAWASYIDDYNEEMQLAAARLMFASVALSLFSAFLLWVGWVVWGLFTAGGVGACLSVMSKMPALSTWGEHAAYRRRLLTRVATGLAASIIGSGFLLSGIVPLTVGSVHLPTVVAACAKQRPPTAGETVPADGKPATTSQSPRDPNYCTASSILMLMAIAMVLGFSERALVSFEDRLFGQSGKPAS